MIYCCAVLFHGMLSCAEIHSPGMSRSYSSVRLHHDESNAWGHQCARSCQINWEKQHGYDVSNDDIGYRCVMHALHRYRIPLRFPRSKPPSRLLSIPTAREMKSSQVYYAIPFYNLLYATLLYYTILYYTILYYTILQSGSCIFLGEPAATGFGAENRRHEDGRRHRGHPPDY